MRSRAEHNYTFLEPVKDGSRLPWRSVSTLAYTSLATIAATTGRVLARPERKPMNGSKTVAQMPMGMQEGQEEEKMKMQRRCIGLHGGRWGTVSLTSLSTMTSGVHVVPSVSLRKWGKEHALQHRELALNMSQGYDVKHITSWKPYFGSSEGRKKSFSRSSKTMIRQLYPFKSKRPVPCLVPISDVDNQRPCSIFSMDSVCEFSNDSMVFSDPEFVSYKYSASSSLIPSLIMKDIPLNVYAMRKNEKSVFNKDVYMDEKCNVRVDQIFEIINPLNKLAINDKEVYECSQLSNKQLFCPVYSFSDENLFNKTESLHHNTRKNLDNTSNDILWDNFNEIEHTDQKKTFESFASTNMFLMNERVPSFYSQHKEFEWNKEYIKEESNEAWDEDFDTDLIIPIDIAKRQDAIRSHLGSIRKFASLIEDLKDLRKIAQKEGDNDEIWPEVEAIIALGTLENDVSDMHEHDSLNNSSVDEKQDMFREVIMRAIGKQFPTDEPIGLSPDNLSGFVNYASLLKEKCQGIVDLVHTFSNITHQDV
ncbi:uncharacterized protein T551_00336 [Pneumocystis jirovecii RU7]|uniref:Uncharacterized protein n=1 Tax=Pneumocystis jirovecii (strain RU7) TaxID=1408657 RepID=A0A0W4ZV28_PNEJ7|nr:uncharacterized protein T551_00336 [Pneumocystis jirovecii RU7]KTW32245.1 hypothetical protein T551_00336 [Pneumocystis jirovecii RU7]